MVLRVTVSLVLAAAVAGCAGRAVGPPSPVQPGGPSASTTTQIAISSANALGSSLGSYETYNEATDPPQESDARPNVEIGGCKNYHEFFAPDRHGDANSTESLAFYDAHCTKLARDGVRIYTRGGASSETIQRMVSYYAAGKSAAIATRSATVMFENATFGTYGGPQLAPGFDASGTAQLAIAGAQTITTGHEVVMEPQQGNTSGFCGDSAGYNVQGIPPQNMVFGWQGGVLTGGTRTRNSDGSVTWSSTRAGTASEGNPSAFSIASGTENTACPIATAMWTLSGGTVAGQYSIPTTATYAHGILAQLTITGATLAGGATLDVSTNASQPFSSKTYITGTVAMSGSTIATIDVDAFGDGSLTVTAGGKTYAIVEWQVVA